MEIVWCMDVERLGCQVEKWMIEKKKYRRTRDKIEVDDR